MFPHRGTTALFRSRQGSAKPGHVHGRSMLAAWALCCMLAALGVQAAPVLVLDVEGAIGPATAAYVERGLAHGARDKAPLVVLQIDTPGGLDTSMRDIIKAIMASPVPVATYVAPGGARAASAGTYILYASHVAAMAPGTNLGAATPVQIGALPDPGDAGKLPPTADGKKPAPEAAADTMTRKQMSDAAAYIRSLAQLRGRNVEWAESAVKEAASLSADEALKLGVIDYVAPDLASLLQQAHGKTVKLAQGQMQLATADAAVVSEAPDWRVRLLAVITNPSVALILMMIGVYGLFFEFSHPGLVAPGVIGAICLLLGLYAMQLLPVNYAGAALLLLGIAFMVAEAFLPSFGVLGLGGVAAFTVGAIILIDTEVPGFGIPLPLILLLAAGSALLLGGIGALALRARRRPVVSGEEELIGSTGEMLDDAEQDGWAQIHGERWRVQVAQPVRRGERVRVTARTGLVLEVVPERRPPAAASSV